VGIGVKRRGGFWKRWEAGRQTARFGTSKTTRCKNVILGIASGIDMIDGDGKFNAQWRCYDPPLLRFIGFNKIFSKKVARQDLTPSPSFTLKTDFSRHDPAPLDRIDFGRP
jgi:hypothetical protein